MRLSIGLSTMRLFGIETRLFSLVRMRVLLKPTFSTVPSTPPTFTLSPTINGLSIKMVNAPKRFSTVSLPANANANPPIPRPLTISPTFKLKTALIITKKPREPIRIFTSSRVKGISCKPAFDSLSVALFIKTNAIKSIILNSIQKKVPKTRNRKSLSIISA
ncbi:hypothetical protein D3C78_1085700 [compost metagenome]